MCSLPSSNTLLPPAIVQLVSLHFLPHFSLVASDSSSSIRGMARTDAVKAQAATKTVPQPFVAHKLSMLPFLDLDGSSLYHHPKRLLVQALNRVEQVDRKQVHLCF